MNSKPHLRVVSILILVFSILFCTGCLQRSPIKALTDYTMEVTAESKIPLRAGLYMNSSFRNYALDKPNLFGPRYGPLHLGESMSSGAERALKAVFEEVVTLDGLVSDPSKYEIKLLVSPEIIDTNLELHMGERAKITCQVVCKWSFARPNGKIVYLNTFVGEITHQGSILGILSSYADCMTLAIQNHYNKFLANIRSVKWWEDM